MVASRPLALRCASVVVLLTAACAATSSTAPRAPVPPAPPAATRAPSPPAGATFTELTGTWNGVMNEGLVSAVRAQLRLARLSSGDYIGRVTVPEQGVDLRAWSISISGDTLRFELKQVGGVFEGTVNAAKTVAQGKWTQPGLAAPAPVVFRRVPDAAADGPRPKPVVERGIDRLPRTPAPFTMPFTARVHGRPSVLRGHGASYLVYELELANTGRRDATICQRFAIDFMRLDEQGRAQTGDGTRNHDYPGYGQEVVSVADARVLSVIDGVAENAPGKGRAVSITLATVAGNQVSLDLGGGFTAFYAHLQPGSVRVKVGDRVRRGQLLGLVGNSGNSTGPHLHFHISRGASILGGEGVPFVYREYRRLTTPPGTPSTAAQAELVRGESPLLGDIVLFADPATVTSARPAPRR